MNQPPLDFRVWDKMLKQFVGFNPILLSSLDDKKDYDFQQFTGVLDKNGFKIFLGDVLSVHKPLRKIYENGEIIWSEEYLTYLVKFFIGKDYYSDYLCDLKNCEVELEVVGNIFENPELVKI